jgi:hypothetical protein
MDPPHLRCYERCMASRLLLVIPLLLAAAPAGADLPIVAPAAGVGLRAMEGRSASPCAELALYVGAREDLSARWGPDAFGSVDLRLGATLGARAAGSLDVGVGLSWGLGEAGRNANWLRLSARPSLVLRTDGLAVAGELGIGTVSGIFPVIVRYERLRRWSGEQDQLVGLLVGIDLGLLAGLAMSS